MTWVCKEYEKNPKNWMAWLGEFDPLTSFFNWCFTIVDGPALRHSLQAAVQ